MFSAWRQVGWQNEIRTLFGMDPVTFTVWPVIIGVAVAVAALLLVRVAITAAAVPHRRSAGWAAASRGGSRSCSAPGGLLLLFWLLITGVLVNGFFAVANVMFSSRDGATSPGIEQPVSALRSGSPDSWSPGTSSAVRAGPSSPSARPWRSSTQFSGGGAMEPIRAYVGLKSADTLQGRADLLLEELKRTGAFDREALVITTTTGTGFLDPNGVDPLEYMFNGDTAIAGVQYSYLPSWISLLADQQAVKDTSRSRVRHGPRLLDDAAGGLPARALPLRPVAGLATAWRACSTRSTSSTSRSPARSCRVRPS